MFPFTHLPSHLFLLYSSAFTPFLSYRSLHTAPFTPSPLTPFTSHSPSTFLSLLARSATFRQAVTAVSMFALQARCVPFVAPFRHVGFVCGAQLVRRGGGVSTRSQPSICFKTLSSHRQKEFSKSSTGAAPPHSNKLPSLLIVK